MSVREQRFPCSPTSQFEDRVPANHPLRRVRLLANEALKGLNTTFDRLYTATGRPLIPPEQLLLALFFQAIYGLRSERLLLEQLDYNMLYLVVCGSWSGRCNPASLHL